MALGKLQVYADADQEVKQVVHGKSADVSVVMAESCRMCS